MEHPLIMDVPLNIWTFSQRHPFRHHTDLMREKRSAGRCTLHPIRLLGDAAQCCQKGDDRKAECKSGRYTGLTVLMT